MRARLLVEPVADPAAPVRLHLEDWGIEEPVALSQDEALALAARLIYAASPDPADALCDVTVEIAFLAALIPPGGGAA